MNDLAKILISLLAVALVIMFFGIKPGTKIDAQTKQVCRELAPMRKYEYRNTAWADFDFFKSCIDNIRYTSPLAPRE